VRATLGNGHKVGGRRSYMQGKSRENMATIGYGTRGNTQAITQTKKTMHNDPWWALTLVEGGRDVYVEAGPGGAVGRAGPS